MNNSIQNFYSPNRYMSQGESRIFGQRASQDLPGSSSVKHFDLGSSMRFNQLREGSEAIKTKLDEVRNSLGKHRLNSEQGQLSTLSRDNIALTRLLQKTDQKYQKKKQEIQELKRQLSPKKDNFEHDLLQELQLLSTNAQKLLTSSNKKNQIGLLQDIQDFVLVFRDQQRQIQEACNLLRVPNLDVSNIQSLLPNQKLFSLVEHFCNVHPESLDQCLQVLQRHFTQDRQRIEQLTQIADKQEQKCRAIDLQRKNLFATTMKQEQQVNMLQTQNQQMTQQIANLNDKIIQEQSRIEKLNNNYDISMNSLQDLLLDKDQKLKSCSDQCLAYSDQVQEQDQQIQQLEVDRKQLQHEVLQLRAKLQVERTHNQRDKMRADDQLLNSQKLLSEHKTQYEEFKQYSEQRIQQLVQDMDDHKSHIIQLEDQLKGFNKDLSFKNTQLESVQYSNGNLKMELEAISQECNALKRDKQSLEEERKEVSKQHQLMIDQYELDITRNQEVISHLNQNIQTLKVQLNQEKDHGFSLKKEQTDQLEKLDKLRQQLSNQQQGLSVKSDEVQKLSAQKYSLEQDRKNDKFEHTEQLEKNSIDLKEYHLQLDKLKQKIQEQEQKLTAKSNELQQLLIIDQESKKEKIQLTQQLEKGKSQIQEQESQIKKFRQQLIDLNQELSIKSDELQTLLHQYQKLELNNNKLNLELETNNSSLHQSNKEIDKLNQNVKKKEQQLNLQSNEVQKLFNEKLEFEQQIKDLQKQQEIKTNQQEQEILKQSEIITNLNQSIYALKGQLNQQAESFNLIEQLDKDQLIINELRTQIARLDQKLSDQTQALESKSTEVEKLFAEKLAIHNQNLKDKDELLQQLEKSQIQQNELNMKVDHSIQALQNKEKEVIIKQNEIEQLLNQQSKLDEQGKEAYRQLTAELQQNQQLLQIQTDSVKELKIQLDDQERALQQKINQIQLIQLEKQSLEAEMKKAYEKYQIITNQNQLDLTNKQGIIDSLNSSIQTLKLQLNEETDKFQLTEELEQRQAQLKEYQSQIDQLKQLLQDQAKISASRQNKLQELQTQQETLEQISIKDKLGLKQQLEENTSQYKQAQLQVQKLEEQLKDQVQAILLKSDEIQKLTSQKHVIVEQSKKDVQLLKAQLEQTEQDLEECHQSIDLLTSQLQHQDQVLESKSNEIQKLSLQNQTLREQSKDYLELKEQLEKSSQQIQINHLELDKLYKQLQDQDQTLKIKVDQVEKLQIKNKQINQELLNEMNHGQQIKQELDIQKQALSGQQSQHKQFQESSNDQIHSLTQSLEKLHEEYDQILKEKEIIEKNYTDLNVLTKQQISRNQKQEQELRMELHQCKQREEEALQLLILKDKEILSLSNQVDKMNDRTRSLTTKVEAMEQYQKLQIRLQQIEQLFPNQDVISGIQNERKTTQQLEKKYLIVKNIITHPTNPVSEDYEKFREYQQNYNAMKTYYDQAKEDLVQAQEEISGLYQQLSEQQHLNLEQNKNHENQINELNSQIDKVKQQSEKQVIIDSLNNQLVEQKSLINQKEQENLEHVNRIEYKNDQIQLITKNNETLTNLISQLTTEKDQLQELLDKLVIENEEQKQQIITAESIHQEALALLLQRDKEIMSLQGDQSRLSLEGNISAKVAEQQFTYLTLTLQQVKALFQNEENIVEVIQNYKKEHDLSVERFCQNLDFTKILRQILDDFIKSAPQSYDLSRLAKEDQGIIQGYLIALQSLKVRVPIKTVLPHIKEVEEDQLHLTDSHEEQNEGNSFGEGLSFIEPESNQKSSSIQDIPVLKSKIEAMNDENTKLIMKMQQILERLSGKDLEIQKLNDLCREYKHKLMNLQKTAVDPSAQHTKAHLRECLKKFLMVCSPRVADYTTGEMILNTLFQFIEFTDRDREELLEDLCTKPADKKKGITGILFKQ